jgi:hypothetical protein
MVSRLTAEEDAYEREEHAQSICEIPAEQLPDAEARAELIRRALAGEEVYAYRPAFAPEYIVWHFRGNPAEDCRWTPVEWARAWRAGEVR